jgi:hypothetical protein
MDNLLPELSTRGVRSMQNARNRLGEVFLMFGTFFYDFFLHAQRALRLMTIERLEEACGLLTVSRVDLAHEEIHRALTLLDQEVPR